MTKYKTEFSLKPFYFLIFSVIVSGILVRFLLIGRGHNYDFESYQIVAAANRQGITAWQTNRYNYGPIWWYLLQLFDWIHTRIGIGFRYQIVGILTLADLYIAFFIYKFRGPFFAVLFFINPISIIITGYHNQFDNLAIAIMCFAIFRMKAIRHTRLDLNQISIVLLLGVSLATKHVFVFFIVWLALKQKTLLLRCTYLFGPVILFGLSFIPYISSSWSSIKLNVIEYRSFNNAPLWRFFRIYSEDNKQFATLLFITLVVAIGFVLRKIELEYSLFIYCIVIVAFSPAIANQYLAIAAIGAIGFFNVGFAMYFIYGFYWLAISPDGLHIASDSGWISRMLFDDHGLHFLEQYDYVPFPVILSIGLFIAVLNSKVQIGGYLRTRNA